MIRAVCNMTNEKPWLCDAVRVCVWVPIHTIFILDVWTDKCMFVCLCWRKTWREKSMWNLQKAPPFSIWFQESGYILKSTQPVHSHCITFVSDSFRSILVAHIDQNLKRGRKKSAPNIDTNILWTKVGASESVKRKQIHIYHQVGI